MTIKVSIGGEFAFFTDSPSNLISNESIVNNLAVGSVIEEGLNNWFSEKIDNLKEDLSDILIYLSEQLKEGITTLMQELVDLILVLPNVSGVPEVVQMWSFMKLISFSIIGLMFVWEGFKKVMSHENIGRTVEFKNMCVRLVYGLILAVLSLDIVDVMINFNNALVETLRDNFNVYIDTKIDTSTVWSYLMTVALVIVQLVLCVRIAIQHFMRLAEIWLMTIIGPVFYVLWINPGMSGYLGSWMRRLFSTIFTTFIWAVILVLYTGLISIVAAKGTIWAMCMSIALLLVMLETPSYLRQFMDAQQNPIQLIRKTKNDIVSKYRQVSSIKNRFKFKTP